MAPSRAADAALGPTRAALLASCTVFYCTRCRRLGWSRGPVHPLDARLPKTTE